MNPLNFLTAISTIICKRNHFSDTYYKSCTNESFSGQFKEIKNVVYGLQKNFIEYKIQTNNRLDGFEDRVMKALGKIIKRLKVKKIEDKSV